MTHLNFYRSYNPKRRGKMLPYREYICDSELGGCGRVYLAKQVKICENCQTNIFSCLRNSDV